MDKVQCVLVEILSNCSNLGTFKGIVGSSQKQPRDADGCHHITPSSQDDSLFLSNISFWDANVELVKTYERSGVTACPVTLHHRGLT